VLAAAALRELEKFDTEAQAKRNVVRAVETVAAKLGNTKGVCRKCYIHPEILNSYMEGVLVDTLAKRAATMAKSIAKLRPEEAAVLALLQSRLAAVKKAKATAPKSVKDALRRSLKLVAQSPSQSGQTRGRKAS